MDNEKEVVSIKDYKLFEFVTRDDKVSFLNKLESKGEKVNDLIEKTVEHKGRVLAYGNSGEIKVLYFYEPKIEGDKRVLELIKTYYDDDVDDELKQGLDDKMFKHLDDTYMSDKFNKIVFGERIIIPPDPAKIIDNEIAVWGLCFALGTAIGFMYFKGFWPLGLVLGAALAGLVSYYMKKNKKGFGAVTKADIKEEINKKKDTIVSESEIEAQRIVDAEKAELEKNEEKIKKEKEKAKAKEEKRKIIEQPKNVPKAVSPIANAPKAEPVTEPPVVEEVSQVVEQPVVEAPEIAVEVQPETVQEQPQVEVEPVAVEAQPVVEEQQQAVQQMPAPVSPMGNPFPVQQGTEVAPVVEAPTVEVSVAEAPVAEAPVAQAPVANAPVANQPFVNPFPINKQ